MVSPPPIRLPVSVEAVALVSAVLNTVQVLGVAWMALKQHQTKVELRAHRRRYGGGPSQAGPSAPRPASLGGPQG